MLAWVDSSIEKSVPCIGGVPNARVLRRSAPHVRIVGQKCDSSRERFHRWKFRLTTQGGLSSMPMPWVRALLHGQVVYARARPDGTLLVQGNRVEVCYSLNASRLYMARATNVVKEESSAILPDEACTPRAESASRLRKVPA